MSGKSNRDVRFWHARIFHGTSFLVWLKLLAYGRFAVSFQKWPHILTTTFLALFTSIAGFVQRQKFGQKIAETELAADPIFVIGHWRSGTTMLHELLILDKQFIFPTTFQCMSPHHFLLFADKVDQAAFLVPSSRPMDDMSAGWHLPQEDEFTLLNLGQPSPYRQILFPDAPRRQGVLSLDGLTKDERDGWKAALDWFLRAVTLQSGKTQLVVKSPTHTARVKTLLELYPNARFVYIHRDPAAVYGSTLKLWKRLSDTQGLQLSKFTHLDARVQDEFSEMMDALERDIATIPEGHLHIVNYAELVADPVDQMRKVYETLGLQGFENAAAGIESYFENRADFQVDQYQLTPERQAEIGRAHV